jgi:hypothetical protein
LTVSLRQLAKGFILRVCGVLMRDTGGRVMARVFDGCVRRKKRESLLQAVSQLRASTPLATVRQCAVDSH